LTGADLRRTANALEPRPTTSPTSEHNNSTTPTSTPKHQQDQLDDDDDDDDDVVVSKQVCSIGHYLYLTLPYLTFRVDAC